MTDINLLLGLSNFVLIWITIYSAVIELKWRHEDRRKEAAKVEDKEKIVREMLQKHLKDLKTVEKKVIQLEKVVENAKKS